MKNSLYACKFVQIQMFNRVQVEVSKLVHDEH